jgi:hypothetical protein
VNGRDVVTLIQQDVEELILARDVQFGVSPPAMAQYGIDAQSQPVRDGVRAFAQYDLRTDLAFPA